MKTQTETGFTLNTEGLTITIKEKEKHTLDDLKQHLIEVLMKKKSYDMSEVEIIKALFENEKKTKEINRTIPNFEHEEKFKFKSI